MRHDPERAAAGYLGGGLSRRRRERFESHMLGCDDCWREVTAARRGRTLAEAAREVAPQRTRENIRALAATAPHTDRRGRSGLRLPLLLTAAGVVVLLVAVGIVSLRPDPGRAGQPAPIAAAVATYRKPGGDWSARSTRAPVARIAAMNWRGASSRDLGGQPATLHLYADDAGHRLVVARSPRPFPEAAHVEFLSSGPSWVAVLDGAVIFCADRPGSSWLAIGASRDQALAAGRALGLL